MSLSSSTVTTAVPTANAASADNTTTTAPLSKNARKRQLKSEKFHERKRLKKEAKKMAKAKARKEAAAAATTNPIARPVVDPATHALHATRRAKEKAARIDTFLTASAAAPRVIIDLDFEEQLTEKEKKSMAQQLMYCYGMNKRATCPLGVHFAGLRGETETMLTNISGFGQWLGVTTSSKPYDMDDSFDKSSLVYLTADSNNVLEEFDSQKNYIIGGIVDRNRLKGITYEKAKDQKIEHARLPIQKYCQLSSSKVLAINHVFEIMLQRQATGSWVDAFLKGIPSRKDIQLKPEYAVASSSPSPTTTAFSTASFSLSSSSSSSSSSTALIIGGSSGIGKGFVKKFVQLDYNVIVVSRSDEKLARVCDEMRVLFPAARLKFFTCDCTRMDDCHNLYQKVAQEWSGGIDSQHVIVHTAGDFKWDNDTASLPPPFTTAQEYLYSSNVLTKQNFVKSFSPLLSSSTSPTTTTFIVVGSQAGRPSFQDDMELKEGKGAVDNEAGYIYAMRSLSEWVQTVPVTSKIVFLEPGLVRTAMAQREFASISSIPWNVIPTPDEYVDSVMAQVLLQ